ncbi:MAG TPA: hypothetical protein PL041_05095 [Melioribacteraceae bacterium]|nr:hypothetical protein [Melioribacteraceae bacterium]
MSRSLSFTAAEEQLVKQLYKELKFALQSFTLEEYQKIFAEASKDSIKSTIKSKAEVANKLKFMAVGIYDRYKNKGVKEAAKEDIDKIKSGIEELPTKVNNIYYNFCLKSNEEKIEIIASLILTASIVFAAGGGTDFEGGLPDLDIAIGGIDAHRNIFSHSILVGVVGEFVLRLAYGVLEKVFSRLPQKHHFLWDRVGGFLQRNKSNTIMAIWMGIGIHLIQDAGLFAGATKPYVGLPVSMPMEFHQSLFAANGIAATGFGIGSKL